MCAFAYQPSDDSPAASTAAWMPPSESPERFRDIVDYNIFLPDRAGINARVQREREPVITTPEIAPPVIVEATPDNPDEKMVLVGIAINGDRPRVFIEDRKAGSLQRIESLGEFSQGQITEITAAHIVYEVAGESRTIALGQTLTGQAPAASGPVPPTAVARPETTTPETTEGGDPPPALTEREALLQRMRAAREAERNANP